MLLYCLITTLLVTSNWSPVVDAGKVAAFKDPNINYAYQVAQHNQTILKVLGIKLSDLGQPVSEPELIQTIKFNPSLIDFDLHCLPTHCYLVAITNKSKRNIELYAWQRTQFDLLVKKDSYAIPSSVKIFSINQAFYIVVAQEQNHLDINKLKYGEESGEPTQFIGNAIFKFTKGYEKQLKYHQFISLQFDPSQVVYYRGLHQFPDNRNGTSHLLVFENPQINRLASFIWSALNDQFWPYQIPKATTLSRPDVKLPQIILNYGSPNNVESCFHQLERLLSDRDLMARHLIESSSHIWRNNMAMTNVKTRVIVNGDVIVRGSVIETPRMTMLVPHQPATIHINQFIDQHSPSKVEDKVNKAFYKLQFIREKLSRAVPADLPPDSLVLLNSPVRFYGPVSAREVIFKNHGIENSNVRINGIPFKQLQHELISLWGSQDVSANVIFSGNVVADTLEIYGQVNRNYYMKDAIDISSPFVQVIDQQQRVANAPAMEFVSVSSPNLILTDNATLNSIRLSEFVTRDSQTQVIFGRKSFKHLSMAHLDLAHRQVLLNSVNISHLINNAIPLRPQVPKVLSGRVQSFSRPIKVNNLIINGLVNRHINLTSLIHDSVKVEELGQVQMITGHKRFLDGVKINHLTTEGSINDVPISEVFNLNYAPPIADYQKYLNKTFNNYNRISGKFGFLSPVVVNANLNLGLVNGVDLSSRVVRRQAPGAPPEAAQTQIVLGMKTFLRPVRVTDNIRLMKEFDYNILNNLTNGLLPLPPPPTINGFDIRMINDGIERQLKNPSPIFIENLEIDGNMFLDTNRWNNSGPPRSSLGNNSFCPLDAISRRLVLGGAESQSIEIPIRVQTLRAKAANFAPQAFNGFTFPRDFVLKSLPRMSLEPFIQPIYGNKFFEQLIISPAFNMPYSRANYASLFSPNLVQSKVSIGSRTSINNISYHELQTFITQERQRNSTGETVLQTLTIYGNLIAKTINGMSWPDDIILKGLTSIPGPSPRPHLLRRIYSPLVFSRPGDLVVENHLGLRGPIQLSGYLNGVNMTEFAQQSVTYGDKDLLSIAKPIRNKIFAGGLTISGEMRAQGLINGINFEELKSRAVLIKPLPLGRRTVIMAPKSFSSDINMLGPISMVTLNNLPLYKFLKRIGDYGSMGNEVRVLGKKTISGQLRVARLLIVDGLINGINFTHVRGNAIILGPHNNQLQFNKTLTVEGDIFVDNLYIDRKNGIIDGIRLGDLQPLAVRRPIAINYEPAKLGPHINYLPQLKPSAQILNAGYIVNPHVQLQQPQLQLQQAPPVMSYVAALTAPQIGSHYIAQTRPQSIPQKMPQQLSKYMNTGMVIGFIQSQYKDVSALRLPEQNYARENIAIRGFHQLDQIDFQFSATTYHFKVGVSGPITSIYFTLPDRSLDQLILPVSAPSAATFMKVGQKSLFLLISENLGETTQQCSFNYSQQQYSVYQPMNNHGPMSRFHVYLFHPLHNSSSLQSAYFDLYQTVDIPLVDEFKHFDYNGNTYVIASSNRTSRIYILLLRGYTGLEIVSYFEGANIEKINLMFSMDDKPYIVIHQSNGDYKLMEPVVI